MQTSTEEDEEHRKQRMKICNLCGRDAHKGLCDMATLEDGRIVHASRIKDDMVDGVRVKNKWRKPDLLEKGKRKLRS